MTPPSAGSKTDAYAGLSEPDPPVMIEPVARPPVRRRIRPDAVWVAARAAWEGGETARSVARRYDVGVPALWKRREAEGWKRPDPAQGPIEPSEGWESYAQGQLTGFEARLEETRELAQDLARLMQGGPLEEAPLWHLGFLLTWRAEHLGPETAEADRAQALAREKAWAAAVWDDDGRLKPLRAIDQGMRRLHRDLWRETVGLPEGAAPMFP